MKKGKYLFFDIECCNGHDICSLGYCLFDENLHMLEKRDILINPENKFILNAHGKRPKIELSYPPETFYKQDNFSCHYEKIKNLLVDKKYTLLGHSNKSDFAFLNMACNRYKLPLLPLTAFDTQKVYKKLYNRPHVEKLENILENLEVDTNKLSFHKSCDDAYASFLVVKEIAYLNDTTLDELIKANEDCMFTNDIEGYLVQNKKYQIKNKKIVDKQV